MTVPLASASGKFPNTGSGVVNIALSPQTARETWHVGRIQVQAAGVGIAASLLPTLRLYRNEIDASSFIDGTVQTRSNIADYVPPLTFFPGETLWCQWTNGFPGDQVTIQLSGERGVSR